MVDWESDRPRPVTSESAFRALGSWVSALTGNGELAPALEAIARLLGAEAAVVVRTSEAHDRRSLIAAAAVHGRPPRRDLLADLLPGLQARLRPGVVALLSDAQAEVGFADSERVAEQLRLRTLSDIGMIVLEARGRHVDHLELHSAQPVRRRSVDLLREMAPALCAAWTSRLPGRVEQLLARSRFRSEAQGQLDRDILDPSNPAGLSRSEYRICALVREGLVAKAIARELNLQESTVRSHLHAIYAKTGASGHVDLLHRLATAPAPARHAISA